MRQCAVWASRRGSPPKRATPAADVAIESADIVLVRSDPRDVAAIIGLARATYHKMVQNLWWATGYNAVAIPLAAGVLYPFGLLLSPAMGAVLMSLSTVIVAINARILRVERPEPESAARIIDAAVPRAASHCNSAMLESD